MIPGCWPELVIAAAWLAGLFLILRVSAFRIDRTGPQRFLGVPYLWSWKYYNPGNFTPSGRRLLYWVWLDAALFMIGAILVMAICD
jgi:hypothetical protein